MKLQIAKKFIDKYTGEKYNEGDIKEFESERAEELLNDERGLVCKPKRSKKTK